MKASNYGSTIQLFYLGSCALRLPYNTSVTSGLPGLELQFVRLAPGSVSFDEMDKLVSNDNCALRRTVLDSNVAYRGAMLSDTAKAFVTNRYDYLIVVKYILQI